MDSISVLLLLCLACACIRLLMLKVGSRRRPDGATIPPGPRGLPVIGNLLDLGREPHVWIAQLSRTYGPIMTLKLGCLTTIVISSTEAAREAFRTREKALSTRPIPYSVRAVDHDSYSMSWIPTAARWRHLRRIAATQMFTTSKLEQARTLRFEKVQELVGFVKENCVVKADGRDGLGVDLSRAVFITLLNLMSNTLFSVDFASHDSDSYQVFHELLHGVMEVMVKPSVVDFFPALRPFDPQRIRNKSKAYFEKLFGLFEEIIAERRKNQESRHKGRSDVLDSFLDLAEEDGSNFNPLDMKHMLLDLLIAGVDPVVSALEWAIRELLGNQTRMRKAQAEIRQVVGNGGWVQESDIPKLAYLQAVVKETLRLHPPAPLLVPYCADSDLKIQGHLVPRGAQVLVNIWAMGRDPSLWRNANVFEPERFLGHEAAEPRSQELELVPFGVGLVRRVCLGLPLAQRVVPLVLASLLHEFDWVLPHGVNATEPLRAVPLRVC